MEVTVNNKYKLTKKIGRGAFGEVFLGVDKDTSEEVAVKLEDMIAKHPQLNYEYKVMKLLQDHVGIPDTRWYGENDGKNVLVMDVLGPSLEDMFNYCKRTFGLKTVWMLADQMIQRIEYVHSRFFIHRDIKPDNFLVGRDGFQHYIYLIDFGLAKRYRDPKTMEHIPYRDDKNLTGTVRYASSNTHRGIEQARRDDLESLGFVLVYFLKGSLPWQGIKAKTKKEKYDKIKENKWSITPSVLCEGLPEQFETYFDTLKDMEFDERPNYTQLRKLFKDVMFKKLYDYDYVFDWIGQNDSKTSNLNTSFDNTKA